MIILNFARMERKKCFVVRCLKPFEPFIGKIVLDSILATVKNYQIIKLFLKAYRDKKRDC